MNISNKFGSIELFEKKIVLTKKSLSKPIEISYETLKETHLKKSSFINGYIRFILNDDKNGYYDSYSDEKTLLFDKSEEENFIKLLEKIAKLSNTKTEILEADKGYKVCLDIFYGCLIFFLLLIGFILLFTELQLGLFFLVLGITLITPVKFDINNLLNNLLKRISTKFNNSKYSKNALLKYTGWTSLLNGSNIPVKIGIIKFVIFIAIFGLIVENMPAPETTTKDTNKTSQKQEIAIKSEYRDNKNAKKIAEITGLNKDKAGFVYEQLVSCGVGNIESITLFADYSNDEYDKPSKCYDIKAFDIPSKITAYIDNNGKILELYYDMNDIIVDGKRVASIKDYVLSHDEWLDLKVQAKIFIEKFLNAPKSAKYRNMNYSINEDHIIFVSGIVEAKNLFGVPLENNFEIEYIKLTNGNFSVQKATLSGQKIY